jgi:2,3-bisphosphoglycerate-dependent phosphoglycerate mutase
MRIFLVRHGESLANVQPQLTSVVADHAIGLSDKGISQARAAGVFLRSQNVGLRSRVRLWCSPYKRTRQTADEIYTELLRSPFSEAIDRREDVSLCEQQFGMFDGLTDEEAQVKHPHEFECYNRAREFEGRFWARYPQGESRMDVALRVKSMFGSLQRDADKSGIHDVIVVTHGVTLRAFIMQFLHYPWEWMEKESNPANCSIRLIGKSDPTNPINEDYGYVYHGGPK